MPKLLTLLPPMLETMKTMKVMMLTMYQTQKGMQDQMAAAQENSTAMGEAFDASKNDDSFYLPPETFDNPEFKKRHEELHLARWPLGALHHLPRRRSDDARRHLAHQRHQAGGQGVHQGHPTRGLQDLSRRHGGDVQGHAGRLELRPADCRNRFAHTDFRHHADHHRSVIAARPSSWGRWWCRLARPSDCRC